MGKIFYLCFLILCDVFLQEMVVAFDENSESSSVPHIRQKRMNHPPGGSSSSSHALPPWFEDLKHVNIENPSLVQIANPEGANFPGYAIHPYFVLTLRSYTVKGVRVFVHNKTSEILERQLVRVCLRDVFGDVVLIQLKNPIMMDNPVHHAFFFEHYEKRATDWAAAKVQEWILYHQPNFKPTAQQILSELRFYDPTKVVMTQNGETIGHGYAIHPYIVIASRNFIRETVGVSSYTETTGVLKPHRVKNYLTHADVGLVRLRNAVPLTLPVPGALVTENYLIEGVAWADATAVAWIRDIMNG